jgi:hypothetical protein
MRTYGLDVDGRAITPGIKGEVDEVVPAPDAASQIAKWHPDRQVGITAIREITEDDVPDLNHPTRKWVVFKQAWVDKGSGPIDIDMPKARDIHAERIAVAQVAEIAYLKVEERKERLKGNTAQADDHAVVLTALEALDLNVLAIQIAAAPNPTALNTIWPVNIPRL